MDNMQNDQKNGSDHWDKPWHRHGYYGHGYNVLRWLLAILILLIVFCLGMKVGKYHGAYGRHGHHKMMPHYYGGMMYDGPGMGIQKVAPAAPGTQVPAPSNAPPANN